MCEDRGFARSHTLTTPIRRVTRTLWFFSERVKCEFVYAIGNIFCCVSFLLFDSFSLSAHQTMNNDKKIKNYLLVWFEWCAWRKKWYDNEFLIVNAPWYVHQQVELTHSRTNSSNHSSDMFSKMCKIITTITTKKRHANLPLRAFHILWIQFNTLLQCVNQNGYVRLAHIHYYYDPLYLLVVVRKTNSYWLMLEHQNQSIILVFSFFFFLSPHILFIWMAVNCHFTRMSLASSRKRRTSAMNELNKDLFKWVIFDLFLRNDDDTERILFCRAAHTYAHSTIKPKRKEILQASCAYEKYED